MHADETYVTRALKAGAHGYLLKDSAGTDLLRAVTALAQHKSFFSPAVSRVMLDGYVRQLTERGITDRYDTLSEREREVFQLIAEGRVNKDIAEILHLSPNTVENASRPHHGEARSPQRGGESRCTPSERELFLDRAGGPSGPPLAFQFVALVCTVGRPIRRAASTPAFGRNFCGRPTWTSAV
jgi:hypothetical protein